MKGTILIVEDDPDIAEGLRYNLSRAGLKTQVAESGEKGLRLANEGKVPPSLIVVDLMLPGMSGMELCRRLRREPFTEKTPIIILTAKASESDKLMGLELGADDYMIKPFSVKELVARIRAVLRRSAVNEASRYEDEHLSIDFTEMRVACRGQNVKLTRKEFALLEALARNPNRLAPRQKLLDDVWGYTYFGDTRTLDVHIRRLRQKLGDCASRIETVVGIGYRFMGDEDAGVGRSNGI
ncbi:MAG TPA: response regulator transcription factor [Pyrinomonadaceae bacterium]|nr:response regulator transcription factor [Pyrinomonadaceae bacterium]